MSKLIKDIPEEKIKELTEDAEKWENGELGESKEHAKIADGPKEDIDQGKMTAIESMVRQRLYNRIKPKKQNLGDRINQLKAAGIKNEDEIVVRLVSSIDTEEQIRAILAQHEKKLSKAEEKRLKRAEKLSKKGKL